MNYDQAMKGAEKAGTERRNKHRPIYRRVAWIVGSIGIIAALIWLPVGPLQTYAKKKSLPSPSTVPQEQRGTARSGLEIPLASSPQSSWPKLVMPANGESEAISAVPPYMHVVAKGDNFLLHTVYRDGRRCTFGQPCPGGLDGPIEKVYATNKAPVTNIIIYAFEPQ